MVRDLDDWQATLRAAEADLDARVQRALEQRPTPAELAAFAAERDALAEGRDALADARDDRAHQIDIVALTRDTAGSARDAAARQGADDHDDGALDRFASGRDRDLAAGDRANAYDDRRRSAVARSSAAEDRRRAAEDAAVAGREIAGLHTALESRLLIGQAEGLLMARYSLHPAEAHRLLVRLSQDMNVKLRELAARLVADAVEQAGTAPGEEHPRGS